MVNFQRTTLSVELGESDMCRFCDIMSPSRTECVIINEIGYTQPSLCRLSCHHANNPSDNGCVEVFHLQSPSPGSSSVRRDPRKLRKRRPGVINTHGACTRLIVAYSRRKRDRSDNGTTRNVGIREKRVSLYVYIETSLQQIASQNRRGIYRTHYV